MFSRPATLPTLSVVVPCFDEAPNIEPLVEQLTAVLEPLDPHFEVILVDDGSRDGTLRAVRGAHAADERFRYLAFSRNFGHEAASTAGIEAARGDAVVLIDADLQDPPEVIAQLVERWREGFEIVYARREVREGETWFKRVAAAAFYRLLARATSVDIPVDTGDFRLMARPAVDAFLRMKERSRFVRGMVAWTGFRTAEVRYRRHARHAGDTKYDTRKLLLLAVDALTGFSIVPLRIASLVGLGFTGLSFLGAILVTLQRLFLGLAIPGYAFLVVGMLLLGGVQLLVLGIIGEYVGRIYVELQARPLYIVAERSEESSE